MGETFCPIRQENKYRYILVDVIIRQIRVRQKKKKPEFFFISLTWHASCPSSPPAQKLDAGRMKIFSVTALILRTHSLSFTTGTLASRTRSGIGPAADQIGEGQKKKDRILPAIELLFKDFSNSLSPMYPYPVTVQTFPACWLVPLAGRHTRQTPSFRSASPCSFSRAMSLSRVCAGFTKNNFFYYYYLSTVEHQLFFW